MPGDVGPQGPKGEQGSVGATGMPGIDGNDGLSAYEIYIKYYPEYTGSEEEWINDLINGNLGGSKATYTVSFNSNGGSYVSDQRVVAGEKATMPQDPVMEGYEFEGWYVGSEQWSFAGHVVTSDMTLVARWKEYYTPGLDFYLLPNGTYGVTYGTAKYVESLIIPSTYNGKTVTEILPEGFINMTNLKTVVIPDSITVIGDKAFYGCSNLVSLTLSKNVVVFGDEAFYDCKKLNGEIIIGKNCNYIGYRCFYTTSCSFTVTPDSLEYIGSYAFPYKSTITWDCTETITWNRTVTGTYNSYSGASYDYSYHYETGTFTLPSAKMSPQNSASYLNGTASETWVKTGDRYLSSVTLYACTWTRDLGN